MYFPIYGRRYCDDRLASISLALVVYCGLSLERLATSRLAKFFPFTLSRAVSIAVSTFRLGMSPYSDCFNQFRTRVLSYKSILVHAQYVLELDTRTVSHIHFNVVFADDVRASLAILLPVIRESILDYVLFTFSCTEDGRKIPQSRGCPCSLPLMLLFRCASIRKNRRDTSLCACTHIPEQETLF